MKAQMISSLGKTYHDSIFQGYVDDIEIQKYNQVYVEKVVD
jgi:hypothetical protein